MDRRAAVVLVSAALLLAGCGGGSDGAPGTGCVPLDDSQLDCRFVGRWSSGTGWVAAVTVTAAEHDSLLVDVVPHGNRPRVWMWTTGGDLTASTYSGAAEVMFYDLDVFDEGTLEIELSGDGRKMNMAADGGSFFGPSTFEGHYIGPAPVR